MKNDITTFCKVCASWKGTRKTFRPPLCPAPVGGPFHRVAVDVLQLPLTAQGNMVFMDYTSQSGPKPLQFLTKKLKLLLNIH